MSLNVGVLPRDKSKLQGENVYCKGIWDSIKWLRILFHFPFRGELENPVNNTSV